MYLCGTCGCACSLISQKNMQVKLTEPNMEDVDEVLSHLPEESLSHGGLTLVPEHPTPHLLAIASL